MFSLKSKPQETQGKEFFREYAINGFSIRNNKSKQNVT